MDITGLRAFGYICATILGIALLCVDGNVAIGYVIAVGCTMVGIDYSIAKRDLTTR